MLKQINISNILESPWQGRMLLFENEKVHVVNLNNGERLETYIIKGERGSGQISLNGAAARKCQVGDVVIIISYGFMDFEEAKSFKPSFVFPDTATNQIV